MTDFLNQIEQISDQHQWLAILIVLVWTFIEGETIVILMGAWANDGTPNIALVILAAFAGSLAGDQTWFFVGRLKGKAVLAKRPAWQLRAQRVYDLLHRHQNWLILGFRFLYGLRNATPFVLGMSEVRTSRFVILNIIGAAVWAISFGMMGYLFGTAVEKTVGKVKLPALGIFLAVVLTAWVIRILVQRRKARKFLLEQQAQNQQTR